MIPESTYFLGGLHDTTKDEAAFYDESGIPSVLQADHAEFKLQMQKALELNSAERSRRFMNPDKAQNPKVSLQQVQKRAVSLFEPRPEYNHATNCLCLIGKRSSFKDLFLDRRAFLNSYDYEQDPDGTELMTILGAAAPVCGGINLEYYFSRVDNERLGAGSKLPHNVMGLIAVANGADGDLRSGLPYQMVEIHDPLRLMVIIEHFPEEVMKHLKTAEATYNWFAKEWIHLLVVHPETRETFRFSKGVFELYTPLGKLPEALSSKAISEQKSAENLHVCLINN
jgi:uncharacterized protein YbcC (UPF0753/DUF2309 family)